MFVVCKMPLKAVDNSSLLVIRTWRDGMRSISSVRRCQLLDSDVVTTLSKSMPVAVIRFLLHKRSVW